MKEKLFFVLLIITMPFLTLSSQETNVKDRLFIEGYYHYGFAVPHHNYLSYFIKEHIQSIQVNVGIHTTGKKNWHKYYNLPDVGIGYHYSNLSNRDIFGNMNAVYAFIDRYFLNRNKRFNFGNRISFGLGYVNKPFNLYSNPFNMAFSSHLNIYANYSLETDIHLFQHANLKIGLSLTHLSNGNTQKPNLGINFLTSFAGIRYTFSNGTYPPIIKPESDTKSNKGQFAFTISYGLKSISRANDKLFPVYSVSTEYSHNILKNSRLGLVITNYFDSSLPIELKDKNPTYLSADKDKIRTTANVTYEMGIGNLSVLLQPGFYIRNKYSKPGIMSNRFGVRYYFSNNFFACMLIKAHWIAVADVLEWGIGYKINK